MITTRFLFAASAALVTLAVAGCGKETCIMGLGDCKQMFKDSPQNPSNPTEALKLTASVQTVPILQKMYFQATGGAKPYQWDIVSGMGVIDDSGVYTAPNTPITTTVRVTDARLTQKLLSVVVTATR